MIATTNDLVVRSRADYEELPDEGRWEVVEGRAILLPPPSIRHQRLIYRLERALEKGLVNGYIVQGVGVLMPPPPDGYAEIQARVPDLIVYTKPLDGRFEIGDPPELVVEVLSTRRGNVERTEKLDDYARAGIGEYWIVDPFARCVEVYRLAGADYDLVEKTGTPSPLAFPWVAVDMSALWDAR